MKKTVIIGCPKSGKNAFAEKLREAGELPPVYMVDCFGTRMVIVSLKEYPNSRRTMFLKR